MELLKTTGLRSEMTANAAKLAALAHPARMQILAHVAVAGTCTCKDVVSCFELAQSTVSQHLKVLVDAGLIKYAPNRQCSRYEIDGSALSLLSEDFSRFVQTCCRPGTET